MNTGPVGSVLGENSFYRKTCRRGPSARCGFVASLPHGSRYPGKIRFIEPRG